MFTRCVQQYLRDLGPDCYLSAAMPNSADHDRALCGKFVPRYTKYFLFTGLVLASYHATVLEFGGCGALWSQKFIEYVKTQRQQTPDVHI